MYATTVPAAAGASTLPHRMRTVDGWLPLERCATRIDSSGKALADAVVLIHPSGSSSKSWQALAGELDAEFRVMTVELHGHANPPGPTLVEHAELVRPLLAPGQRVHLVGHSFGGGVALKAAALWPAAVASVALYEPAMFGWMPDHDADGRPLRSIFVAVAEEIRDRLAQGDANAAARAFITFWSGATTWEAVPLRAQQIIAHRMPEVLRHFESLFVDSMTPCDVKANGHPLLVLAGSETVPGMQWLAQRMRLALPHARHEWIPGLGHMGPATDPARVNPRIAAFLRRHAAVVRGAGFAC
ncbi:alpha/beta hydrolase [Variovorax humicola]|uniref:Alpha/beta hydrolase n=1 Tax=Variovorax humicola TaxID=1769758 RepID=A0ABU8WAB6_9BURK